MSFQLSSRNITLDGDNHTLKCECQKEDGTWQYASIDLNKYIGNIDGWFTWDEGNFSHSARTIRLEGEKLWADLTEVDGLTTVPRQVISLGDRIKNENGVLKYKSK
ncbi:hypothetical protein MFIFM68171_02522 [Madurella fahalii]|uniref:Cyanovirin-N domain-containing protein n=1 Tax=Madurella fahalii TaxID=1157608 RepID=A0ABQ0G3J7_9PEZI